MGSPIIWNGEHSLNLTKAIKNAEQTTVASPEAGSRILYAKSDGWYVKDSSGLEQQLAIAGAGLDSLNGLTVTAQTFAVGTAGTDFGIASSGSVHTFNLPDASLLNRGLVTTSAQSFAGAKTFSANVVAQIGIEIDSGFGIENSGVGTLNIGTSNNTTILNLGTSAATSTINVGTGAGITTINIGGAGDTVNISGTLTTVNTTNLEVTDKLITLNDNGPTASGDDSGIQIEENALHTAYVKTGNSRNSWTIKAPASAGVLTLTPGSNPTSLIATGGALTFPNVTGTVVTTADTGTVTGPMIASGVQLVNAQMAALRYLDSTKTGTLNSIGLDTNVTTYRLTSLTGTPNNQLNSITGAVDGDVIVLVNELGGPDLVIANSVGAAGILTGSGVNLNIKSNGSISLVYNLESDRWNVVGAAGSGGLNNITVSSATATVSGNNYIANTSAGAFTLTLPSGTSGAVVGILDSLETWGSNNLTVAPATGQAIDGYAINETLVMDASGTWAKFHWQGTKWAIEAPVAGSSSQSVVQNGNSLGTNLVIGTNDNFGLNFKTNGATRASISSTGAATFNSLLTASSALVVDGPGSGNLTGTNWRLGILGRATSAANAAVIQLGDNETSTSRQWAITNGWANGSEFGSLNFLVSTAVNTDALNGSGARVLSISSAGVLTAGPAASTANNISLNGSLHMATIGASFVPRSDLPIVGARNTNMMLGNSGTGGFYAHNGAYFDGVYKHSTANIAAARIVVTGSSSLTGNAFIVGSSQSVSHAADSVASFVSLLTISHQGATTISGPTTVNSLLTASSGVTITGGTTANNSIWSASNVLRNRGGTGGWAVDNTSGTQVLSVTDAGQAIFSTRSALDLAGATDQALSVQSISGSGQGFALVAKSSTTSGGRPLSLFAMGQDADHSGDMVFDVRSSANGAFSNTTFDAFRFRHAGATILSQTRAGALTLGPASGSGVSGGASAIPHRVNGFTDNRGITVATGPGGGTLTGNFDAPFVRGVMYRIVISVVDNSTPTNWATQTFDVIENQSNGFGAMNVVNAANGSGTSISSVLVARSGDTLTLTVNVACTNTATIKLNLVRYA